MEQNFKNGLNYDELLKLAAIMNIAPPQQVKEAPTKAERKPKPSSRENAKKARDAKLQKLKEKKMLWEMAQKQLKEEKKSKKKSDSSSSDEEILYINPKKKTVRKSKVKQEVNDQDDLNQKIDMLMKQMNDLSKGGSRDTLEPPIPPLKRDTLEQPNVYYQYPSVRQIPDPKLNDYMKQQILKWN